MMSGNEEEEDGITLQHCDVTHLSVALLALREVGSLCDLLIRCDEEEGHDDGALFAHACVLAACSPVLKQQITGSKQAGDEFTEISGHGCSKQVWEYIIRFMYTAHVFIPTRHQHMLKDIAMAADRLQFTELSEVAAEYQTVLQLMEKEDGDLAGSEVKAEPQDEEEDAAEAEEEEVEEEEKMEEDDDEDGEDEAQVEIIIKHEDAENSLLCMLCPYKAKSKRGLVMHSRKHAVEDKDKKTFPCKSCIQTFPSERALRSHIRWHKTDIKFQCHKCDFVGSTMKELSTHKKEHKEAEKCPVEDCSFVSTKYGLVSKHLKTEHADVKKPFKCAKCDFCGETRQVVRIHGECHDSDGSQCAVCIKIFKRKRDLTRHMLQIHNNDRYHCTMCERTFSRKVYKEDHIRRDHNIGLLVCPVPGCGIEFATYDRMYRHKRLSHDNKTFERHRRHMCGQCGRAFFTSSHLLTHERSHNNERPFSCEVCDKSFLQRSDLTKHLMIHNGVKPFLCSVCPYTTNRASNLKTHERRHKGQKKSMRQHGMCLICGVQYSSLKDFRKHQQEEHGIITPSTVVGKKRVQIKTIRKEPQFDRYTDNDDVVKQPNLPETPKELEFHEIIVRYEEQDIKDEDEPAYVATTHTPITSTATTVNVLEKRDVISKQPSKTAPSAVERRIPKSAILAEYSSIDNSTQSSYPVYTSLSGEPVMVQQQQQQPHKYTQIITTTLANSSRIQTVLQSSSSQLPTSLCIISSSSSSQQAEPLPAPVIHDVSLATETEEVEAEATHYSSPAVYTIMNPPEVKADDQLISPQPTAMDEGEEDYMHDHHTSKDD